MIAMLNGGILLGRIDLEVKTLYILNPLNKDQFPPIPEEINVEIIEISALSEITEPLSNVFVAPSEMDEALLHIYDPNIVNSYLILYGIPDDDLPIRWVEHPHFKSFVPKYLKSEETTHGIQVELDKKWWNNTLYIIE